MTSKEKVSVIIVSHNNKNILPKSLEGFRKQTFKEFKTYLVDNDSTDGSEEFIKVNYPEVKFINISAGVDKKRNMVIASSDSEYVVTFDSDAIPSRDWIEKAVEYMDHHRDVGICCGKLVHMDGTINFAGGMYAKNGGSWDYGFGEKDSEKFNRVKRISTMTTAAAVMRREMIKDIGAFDENYYWGYEDVDFGLRANFAGWKVVYNPDLKATHLRHSTVFKKIGKEYVAKNPNISFYIRRNIMMTLFKNFEINTLLKNFPFIMLQFVAALQEGDILPELKAYFWIISNFKKVIKSRKNTFKKKRLSDAELFDQIYFPFMNSIKQNKISSLFRNIKARTLKNLTFFITTKCNSRCKHCFYWKSLNTIDLDLKQIEKVISNFYNIHSVSLSGGEPFLRKDLRNVIKLIIKYSDAKTIHIPTNCIMDATDEFEKILKENPDTTFTIDCSLDGLKEDHDYIRGISGGFERTIDQIYKFAGLKKRYANFKCLSVNTVITNRNIKNMPKFIEFVKKLPVASHSFDIIRGDYKTIIGPPKLEEIKEFNKLRYKTHKWYNKKLHLFRRIFNNLKDKELIRIQQNVLNHKKWPVKCTAGTTELVIESDGGLRICELQPKIGNLLKDPPENLLKTDAAKKIFQMEKNHACDCTHICMLSSSMNRSLGNLLSRPFNYLVGI